MSNPDLIMVKPVRPFQDEKDGWKEPGGLPYEVTRSRASELKANGLVEYSINDPALAGEKVAEAPENKMSAVPANKAEPAAGKK